MKAVRVIKEGSSTELSVQDIQKPSIGHGELLVKIRASFVQPADILNSKGSFSTTVGISMLNVPWIHGHLLILLIDWSRHFREQSAKTLLARLWRVQTNG